MMFFFHKLRQGCGGIKKKRNPQRMGEEPKIDSFSVTTSPTATLSPEDELDELHLLRTHLFDLPMDVLYLITDIVDDDTIASWLCAHPLIADVGTVPSLWRRRCLHTHQSLIANHLTPLFRDDQPQLSWKECYRALKRQPNSLCPVQAEDTSHLGDHQQMFYRFNLEVSQNLYHINPAGLWTSIRANRPFLSYYDYSSSLSGREYFELVLVRNTVQFNRAIAIGISAKELPRYVSFLGWSRNSIAYHSDDGTIRSENVIAGEPFGTSDVVGCGIDWEKEEVFFTKNGVFQQAVKTKSLRCRDWYPAIGTMCIGDTVRVNFGSIEFAYDVNNYAQDRAGQKHSAYIHRVVPNRM
eukprot:TRINITY_DN7574_c0_g1_i1.p1 TRINITY_DN7574_c0_g1~~TRINITY_DN7574_c0_g1_i1.p1  ORF type:complete len:353 (-),score=33.58 TRINITY_DN7574_c0_g1_i1:129-1187(-)